MKKTKKIAISSIMASLGVVILYIGAVLDVLDISAACIASMLVLFCLVEMGIRSALGVYAVITVLSFLVLPQKLAALFFALFFGLLPITKLLFERLGTHIGMIMSYVLKIVLFNAELTAFGFFARELLEIPDSIFIVAVYIILSNIIFILVDILYGMLVRIYFRTFRKRISKFLK